MLFFSLLNNILIDLKKEICYIKFVLSKKPGWWNGLHKRLKISRSIGLAGSNPAPGTNLKLECTGICKSESHMIGQLQSAVMYKGS